MDAKDFRGGKVANTVLKKNVAIRGDHSVRPWIPHAKDAKVAKGLRGLRGLGGANSNS